MLLETVARLETHYKKNEFGQIQTNSDKQISKHKKCVARKRRVLPIPKCTQVLGSPNAKHGLMRPSADSRPCHWGFVRHPYENYVCVCHRSGNAAAHALSMIFVLSSSCGSIRGHYLHRYRISVFPSSLSPSLERAWWGGEIVAVGPQCSSDWA